MNKQEQLSYLKELSEHNNSAGFTWVLDILIQHNKYGGDNYILSVTPSRISFNNGIVDIYIRVNDTTNLITTMAITNVFVDERYVWSDQQTEFPTVEDLWDYLD